MGPANEIFQEGIRIPPVRIVRGGQVDREMLDLILLNVRTPENAKAIWSRRSALAAWASSGSCSWRRSMASPKLQALIEELLDYSERLVRAELRNMPAGEFSAEDWLDDDGVTDEPRKIAVRLRFEPRGGGDARGFCRLVRRRLRAA